MSYSVDTFSGSRTFVVEDGTIDNSIDLRLIGKNYAGYGEVQNENFVGTLVCTGSEHERQAGQPEQMPLGVPTEQHG